MKVRPILFSAPMVRPVLTGEKTQTRRVVNPQPVGMDLDAALDGNWLSKPFGGLLLPKVRDLPMHCPYGQPGDRLWVRETWRPIQPGGPCIYLATDGDGRYPPGPLRLFKWRPSIHMPRWASRITLEVTGVRVERLQDISEADAVAEGIERMPCRVPNTRLWRNYTPGNGWTPSVAIPQNSFRSLWESINGPGSWDLNPWVWVVDFRRLP